MRERFEEGDDRGKGGDVGGRRAVFERGEVDIPEVNGHEYVLVPVHRFDGTFVGSTCKLAVRVIIRG